MNLEKILETTGAIYETALQPTKWQDALDQVADNVGADTALLGLMDPNFPEVQLLAASSQYVNRAVDYGQLLADPQEQQLIQLFSSQPPRKVLRDTDIWDQRELEAMPVTQWIMENLGQLHRCGVLLCEHRAWVDSMVISYSKDRGGMTAAEEQILQMLLPHLARAVEIQRPLNILRRRYNAVMSVLDRLQIGVAILFENGSTMLVNREAERVFSDRDGLYLDAKRRIMAQQLDQTKQLHIIINKVVATANAQGNTDGELIAITRRSQCLPYLVEVAPLRDDGQETGEVLRGAMVFIVDPERTDVVSVKGLAVAFGLSDAEQEVCHRLAMGRTNEEIADIRGVALETVKTQVKAVLNKTRTRNRTELVHLAVKVLPPIDGTG